MVDEVVTRLALNIYRLRVSATPIVGPHEFVLGGEHR